MKYITYDGLKVWFDRVGYKPRAEAEEVHRILLEPNITEDGPKPRTVVVGGGEQAGKSYCGGHHAFGRWMLDEIVWAVGNRHEDARREYEYCLKAGLAAGVIAPGQYSTAKEGPWELQYINGHILKTLDSADHTKLAREAPDGIILCEPGRQTIEAFSAAHRRVVPKSGWLLVIGTHEGENAAWYGDLCQDAMGPNPWDAVFRQLPSWANAEYYPGGRYDPKIVAEHRTILASNPRTGEEEFNERFGGLPKRRAGLVFDDFLNTVHLSYEAEFDPARAVTLIVDPGYNPSSYAVGFVQQVGNHDHLFDEIYVQKMVHKEVLDVLANHYALPNVRHVVMDIAGTAHSGAGDSAYETWTAFFRDRTSPKPVFSGQYVEVMEGIQKTHDRLRNDPLTQTPFLLVHPRCLNTTYEFTKGYKYNINAITGRVTRDKPIDADNHMMKALAYYFVDKYGYGDLPPFEPIKPQVIRHKYDQVFRRR